MPAAKAFPQFETLSPYVDPFGASRTVISLWTDYWRASAETAQWWTQRWLQSASALLAAAPGRPAPAAQARTVAAVIDIAQAAAARTTTEVGDAAAAVVEIAETVAEVPVVLAEEAVSVVEHAAQTLAAAPDDLTRLVGIGPKLAAALAERGVTRFAEIAAWTESDLVELDKALDLKGRAVRDAWVAQAKRFTTEA